MLPTSARRRQAMSKAVPWATLVRTKLDQLPEHTINALLGYSANELSKAELDEIALMIAKASEKKHGE